MYTAGTLLGAAIFGVSTGSLGTIDWSLQGRAFYESLASGLRPLVLPFVVGNLVLGASAGLASFVALRWLLARRKRVAREPASGSYGAASAAAVGPHRPGSRARPRTG